MIQEEDKLLLLAGIFRSIFLTSQVIIIKIIGLNDVMCIISYAENFLTKIFKLETSYKLAFIFGSVRSKIKYRMGNICT